LYGLFSGDSEEKRLKQELEEKQQEKERALQQLEDFAVEISDGFESSLRQIVLGELDKLFETLITQVGALRQSFDEVDCHNSQRLEQLLEIHRQALIA
jgi:predicted nuclease with TOPRIM domain